LGSSADNAGYCSHQLLNFNVIFKQLDSSGLDRSVVAVKALYLLMFLSFHRDDRAVASARGNR
jgi:hypothetical protein